jgi:hypothetical protein
MPFRNQRIPRLIVGSPSGPGLVIDSTVPAILQTFYTSAGLTLIQVSYRAINAAGNYYYQVTGAASDARVFTAEGVVYPATASVVELVRVGAINATTPHTTYSLLNRPGVNALVTAGSGGGLAWGTTATSYWVFNFPVVGFFRGVDMVYDGNSLSRGTEDAVMVTTAGTLSAASALEQDVPNLALNLAAHTGNSARTYLVTAAVDLSMTVATDQWELQCRLDTAGSGTVIGRTTGPGVASEVALLTFPWTPADDNAHSLHFSHLRAAGTGTLQAFGSPGGGIIRTWASITDDTAAWRTS